MAFSKSRAVVLAAGAATLGVAIAAATVFFLLILIVQQSIATAALEHQAREELAAERDVGRASLVLLARVNAADLSARTYLLSPAASRLQRFQKAAELAEAAMGDFAATAGQEPPDAAQVSRVRRLTSDRLQLMRQMMRLADEGDRVQALSLIEQGDALSLELAREVGARALSARAQEAKARAERLEIARRSRRLEIVLAGLTTLALLLVLASMLVERTTARRANAARRRMDAALDTARIRAEEADKAKSRFLAAASHDMRQPLHALALYISALEQRIRTRQGREILANMDAAVQTMTRMFSALLDLARLEAGVLTPEPVTFRVGELLQEVARHSVDPAGRKDLIVRVVPTDLEVFTDPELLEIVLRNLASNAVRHSRGGKVLLGCRRAGGLVRIEVHDDGQGIPSDQLDQLFSEFVRGDTARSTQGVGLGLAIVERIAKLLGHPLSVESSPGKGSVFCITAPRAAAGVRAVAAAAEQPSASLSGARVLVADDEPLARDAMAVALEDAGAKVVRADSGEAIRRLADRVFDAYVVDLNLGGEDGLDLLEHLARRRGGAVAGLIVTGATTPEALAALRGSGRPWLTKPIAADELSAAVCGLLSNRAELTST